MGYFGTIAFIGFVIFSQIRSWNDIGVSVEKGEVVNTQSGKVRGNRNTLHVLEDKNVDSFLAIPYAQPPVGKLRFRNPVEVEEWEGIYEATSAPKSCPQLPSLFPIKEIMDVGDVDENCLFLNVFVPGKLDEGTDLPVMVWVHGGGYLEGSSSIDLYDGRFLAATSNAIVVSFNYRLGAFGFLSVESNSTEDNVGLLDQVAVLKWVKNNIEYFGGNPNRVTMFGESAGAASISLHLFFPDQNLFQQAILQSGSPLNPWSIISLPKARSRSQKLFELAGCAKEDADETVECMREISMDKILEHSNKVLFEKNVFLPTVDGVLLEDIPMKLLAENKFKKVPILAGSNKDEATYFLFVFFGKFFNSDPPHFNQQMFTQSLKDTYHFYPQRPTQPSELTHTSIFERYSPDEAHKDDFSSNIEAINNAMSDSTFICPLNNFVASYYSPCSSPLVENNLSSCFNQSSNTNLTERSPIYSYYFTQHLKSGPFPDWMGASHAFDLIFTFSSVTKYPANYTDVEISFSRVLIKMWSNFVKTGNPNGIEEKDAVNYPYWPEYTSYNQTYLELNDNFLNMTKEAEENMLRNERCSFWNTITPVFPL